MPTTLLPLARSSGWPGLEAMPTASEAAVWVMARDDIGVATMIAAKRQGAAISDRIDRLFGARLPEGPQRVSAGKAAFIGVGPGIWLATEEAPANAFAERLAQQVGDIASVSDQTDAVSILRVGGAMIRATLCKLIPVDIHARTFGTGASAVTVAAHIGVTLWRLEDEVPESPVFELAVPRSMAGSFWNALSESAAEFGMALRSAE